MFRFLKRKPIARRVEYLKFGFARTATIQHFCPRCNGVLNAGPNYQPNYCDRCGQRITFDGVKWTPEEWLDYDLPKSEFQRGWECEPFKN